MTYKSVIGVKITCDYASVGIVAILRLDLERVVFVRRFCTVSAGVGVSDHFDQALFSRVGRKELARKFIRIDKKRSLTSF